jgi:hypothetical protein
MRTRPNVGTETGIVRVVLMGERAVLLSVMGEKAGIAGRVALGGTKISRRCRRVDGGMLIEAGGLLGSVSCWHAGPG